MAIMIPDILDKNKSDAERKIFEWFKNDQSTSDWIVLHSYSIAKHKTLIVGEADFVVLAPKYGIFVLEVKGGRVERENGKWKYTNRNDEVTYKSRGPFEQASDCVFSIMNLISDKFGKNSAYSKLLFGYGIMTPDINFDYCSPEFNPYQVFDIRNNHKVGRFIRDLSGYCKETFKETYKVFDDAKYPTKEQIDDISAFLRPNFEVQIPLLHKLNESDERIGVLTDEQYNTIDQISDNKRILVLGGAGTGKTLLALQTLKKKIISSEERVAFLCFNSNLGEWLKKYVHNNFDSPNCFVGSFHSFLRKEIVQAGMNYSPNLDDGNLFSDNLILDAVEAIDKNDEKYDYLIVDEFQDLFNDHAFLVFDVLLKGGIKRGSWILFADFDNQDIYTENDLDEQSSIERLENITSFARSRLKINCRNTVTIVKEIENIVNVTYKSVINQINGIPVTYTTFLNETEEIKGLINLLEMLEKENIKKSDIILLSPKKYSDSIVSKINKNIVIYNPTQTSDNLRFSTIHSFKGLESKIVIVTDLLQYDNKKLLYIAYSRARTGLYIFESKVASNQRAKLLMEKLLK